MKTRNTRLAASMVLLALSAVACKSDFPAGLTAGDAQGNADVGRASDAAVDPVASGMDTGLVHDVSSDIPPRDGTRQEATGAQDLASDTALDAGEHDLASVIPDLGNGAEAVADGSLGDTSICDLYPNPSRVDANGVTLWWWRFDWQQADLDSVCASYGDGAKMVVEHLLGDPATASALPSCSVSEVLGYRDHPCAMEGWTRLVADCTAGYLLFEGSEISAGSQVHFGGPGYFHIESAQFPAPPRKLIVADKTCRHALHPRFVPMAPAGSPEVGVDTGSGSLAGSYDPSTNGQPCQLYSDCLQWQTCFNDTCHNDSVGHCVATTPSNACNLRPSCATCLSTYGGIVCGTACQPGVDGGTTTDGPLPAARIVFNEGLGMVRNTFPSELLSGQAFALPLEILDANNKTVTPSNPITLSIESAEHPSILTGAGTLDANAGYVTFANLSLDHWGKVHLLATSAGAEPLRMDVTVHGSHRQFLVQPTDAISAQPITPAVQATVLDETGAVDEGAASLSLGLAGCGSSPDVAIATATAQAGIATFAGLAIAKACDSYQLQINVDSFAPYKNLSVIRSDVFKVIPGPPVQLALSTALGYVTRQIPFTVVAAIEDKSGNVSQVPPTSVTLALTGATLGDTLIQTTSASIATFSDLLIDPVGTYTLTGKAAGYPDVTLTLPVSSWQLRSQPSSNDLDLAIAIDDAQTVYVWDSDWTMASHDGAITWTTMMSYPFAGPVVPHPTEANILWHISSVDGSISRSTDRGATWEPTVGDVAASKMIIDSRSPSRIFTISLESPSGTTGRFWSSLDGGSTWTDSGPGLTPGDRYWDMAYDSSSGLLYVAAGQYNTPGPTGYLARSSDGGQTWTKLPGVPLLRNLTIDPFVPTTIYGTTEVTFLLGRSTDRGATWTYSASQIGGILACNPAAQGHYLVSIGSPTKVLLSTDGGVNWSTSLGTIEAPLPFATALVFAPSAPSTVYAAVAGAIFRSRMGGE